MKKHIKLFEEFANEINETVYQLGFDGSGKFAARGDSRVKSKVLSLLRSGKWEKNEAGKWAMDKAKELADMWNSKDPAELPGWIKSYSTDKEGKFKMNNFISKTAIIVAVLDEISKRESATMESAGGARNMCFGNSAEWAKNNDGKAIGGICIDKKKMAYYSPDSLVVHAFVEKGRKYYDVTITAPAIVNSLIYWPLITFDNADEKKIAEDTWSYALGIEEAVDEYIQKYL
jgi:hypothetical protein